MQIEGMNFITGPDDIVRGGIPANIRDQAANDEPMGGPDGARSSAIAGEIRPHDGHEGDSERRVRENPLTGRSEFRASPETDGSIKVHATASEARKALTSSVADIMARLQMEPTDAERRVTSLVASAGIGKTETLCRQILSGALKTPSPGSCPTVWFAVPNHDMVDQLVKKLKKMPEFSEDKLFILKGRDQPDMCRRADVITRAGSLALQIQKTFCDNGLQRCPYFAECEYQQMRREAQAAKGCIIVMTHASLVRHPWLPEPDLVVIDEAVWSTIVTKLDFSLETFDRVATEISTVQDLDPCMQKGAVRHLDSVRMALTASDREMLRVLRERKLDAGKLMWLAGIVAGDESQGVGLAPDMSDEDLSKRLKDKLAPARRQVASAIRQLAAEIALVRPVPIGVTYERDETIQIAGRALPEQQARIHVFGRHEFQIPAKVPILLLDASADPMIDRALWGETIEHVYVRARRNMVGKQSTSRSGSRRSLVPTGKQSPETVGEIAKLQKRIACLVPGDGTGVAVFGSKQVIEALRPHLPENAQPGHFNALRGLDRYEHCHTAIVVGREQPGCRNLEDIARSLFSGDEKPIITTLQLKEDQVRLKGCDVEITSEVHPDKRVQAVLAQIREREIEQAMDRLRLINDDPIPKTVILISRVATDAEIAVAMKFPELWAGGPACTRAIASTSVVRLSDDDILADIDPEWRDLWKEGVNFRMQYQRAAKTAGLSREAWLHIQCPRHRLFEYQLREDGKLKGGRRRRVLIRDDVCDPVAALQAKFGTENVTNLRELLPHLGHEHLKAA